MVHAQQGNAKGSTGLLGLLWKARSAGAAELPIFVSSNPHCRAATYSGRGSEGAGWSYGM